MMAEFSLNPQVPAHIRQLCSIILKNFIKDNWEKIEEDVDHIPISEKDKFALRSSLPRGLMDPIKKIRTAMVCFLILFILSFKMMQPNFLFFLFL